MKKIIKYILVIMCVLITSGCVDIELNTSKIGSQTKDNFSHEITKQYKGSYNIGYYIEGKATNNSDKDYSYLQIEFICYDKEGNNLGTAIDNTNNLLAKQTWKFKAMAMISDVKSIDHCDYHDITGW